MPFMTLETSQELWTTACMKWLVSKGAKTMSTEETDTFVKKAMGASDDKGRLLHQFFGFIEENGLEDLPVTLPPDVAADYVDKLTAIALRACRSVE